ncbi:D-alanyl-D-alanine carboxypeptidase family protein [Paenibacillus sp. ISL-20]|uniref:D-alanyl-D-alanine carboxypeptidase family protein n=1 Tax=Paenibacillus sp. ISL-20 TaxID=2819163 RepID=UPI001BE6CA44|nr:D-alanyl-D-alanine carboxypeptidase family protein [Paenibacillus sp. ISL-20]MBT2760772.1 D-alanyl-D-alanine carboxypeptidase [Paenibacillus sp. ISL-20]
MMKMKWTNCKSLLSMLMVISCLLVTAVPVHADHENGPTNHAQAAALIDVTSGRVLYSKNGDERLRIASLTKIMTAIVAIEHGKLDDRVKISKNAFAKEGSSLFLKLGEEMTLENLLYGLMLRSGNDAATAIAEHVGGTEEGFVLLMNEKAAGLGLTNSHFMNPHGLDHDEHYSSANDVAKLTAYALKNPIFSEIVKTPTKKAPNPNEAWDYKWDNKNKMLRFYEGADGVKTGYTKKAFRCLVSSATRNGQQIAAVTLNDGNDWNDHSKMLDYGFAHFPLKKVTEKGQKVQGYSLVTGSSFTYAFAHDEEARLVKRLVLHKASTPDLSFGLRGHIELLLDNVSIGKVPVYAEGSKLPEVPEVLQKSRSTSGPLGSLSLWQSAGEVLRHLFRAKS